VGAREHLYVLGQRRVPGHRAVVGAVQADELGEHMCVAGIALRAGRSVPFAVARHLQRIHRVDGVAGRDQRLHPRPAVGLDADHHLVALGILGQVIGDQGVQRRQAIDSLG
jgi:hypothetical protein